MAAAHRAGWRAAIAVWAALVLPSFFLKGMFWDGVVYGTISRNLAVGIGSFWHPRLTDTFMRDFRDHPPLALWLQSILFWAFGDQFWIERLYGLITLALTIPMLVATWRCLLPERPGAGACSWLAVGLWAPFGFWCYRNNMLENTMTVFTSVAVYASLQATDGRNRAIAWALPAGVATAAAVLSKGPVGLFPLVAPTISWLTLRRATIRQALVAQSIVVLVVIITVLVVLMPPPARQYAVEYWHGQIVRSMLGQRETVSTFAGRFEVLRVFFVEMLPALAIVGLGLLALTRWLVGRIPADAALARPAWFCLLMGLAGSLPLMISVKQSAHYTAPSVPYLLFAIALFCVPCVLELMNLGARPLTARIRLLQDGSMACIVGASLAMAGLDFGALARDDQLIRAADELATHASAGRTIQLTAESWRGMRPANRLKLHAYLYRYHRVSLFAEEETPVWRFECHRLTRPAGEFATGPMLSVAELGLQGQLLEQPISIRQASGPVIRR